MAFGSLTTILRADLQQLDRDLAQGLQKLRAFHNQAQQVSRLPVLGGGGGRAGASSSPTGRLTPQARSEVDEFLRHERESIRAVARERERAAAERLRLDREAQRQADQFFREEQRREQQRIRQAQQASDIRRRFETTRAGGTPSRQQVERAFTSAAREVDQLFRGVETKAKRVEAIFAGAGGSGVAPAVRKAGSEIRRSLVKNFEDAEKRASNLAKIVGGITLGGITLGVGTLLREAFQVNKEFERYKISLQSILAITNNVVDANGKLVTGARAFEQFGKTSDQLFRAVRTEAAETILEFPELIQVFSENLGNAVKAGLSIDIKDGDVPALQLVSRIAQLAKTQGLIGGTRQLSQEVRAILTGQGFQAATVGKILGLTQKQIEAAIEQGNLQEVLNKKLAAAEPLVARFRDSFEGVVSTLKSQGQEILQRGFEKTFQRITVFLRGIRDNLTQAKIDEFADKIADGFEKIFEIGKAIAALDPLGKIKSAIDFIVKHQNVIIGVFAAIAGIKVISTVLGGLIKFAELMTKVKSGAGLGGIPGVGPVGLGLAIGAPIASAFEGATLAENLKGAFAETRGNAAAEALDLRTGSRFASVGNQVRAAQEERAKINARLAALLAQEREAVNVTARPTLGFGGGGGFAATASNRQPLEKTRQEIEFARQQLEDQEFRIAELQVRKRKAAEEDKKESEDKKKRSSDDLKLESKARTELLRQKRAADEKERIEAKKALAEATNDKFSALRAQFELDKIEINETVKSKKARNIQLQALEIALRDAEKKVLNERLLGRLDFEKETAERQGQFRLGVNLELKAEEVQNRELLRNKEIDLREFNQRRIANEKDAGKRILDERQRLEKEALDIAVKFSDLVREQQKRRLDFQRELAEKQKEFAKQERDALFGIVEAQNAVTDAIRKRNELQEDQATEQRRRGVQFDLRRLLEGQQSDASPIRQQLQDLFEGQVRRETGGRLTDEQEAELARQRVEDFIDDLADTIVGPGGVVEALKKLKEVGLRTITVADSPPGISLNGELPAAATREVTVGGVAVSPEVARQFGTLGIAAGRLNRQQLERGQLRQAEGEIRELGAAEGAVAAARTGRIEARDELKELRDEFTRTRQELVENFQKETRDAAISLRELNLEARNFLTTLLQGDIALSQGLVAGVRGAAVGNPLAGAQSQVTGLGVLANGQAANVTNSTSSNISITINGQDAAPTITPRAKSLLRELEDELTKQSRVTPVKSVR